MKKANRFVLGLTALLLAALACNLPQGQATDIPEEPNAAFTAAAQTVAAQLTQSALTMNAPTVPVIVLPPTNTTTAPTIAPPLTFPPTVPPTSTQICDKAQFVADMTIPDGTVLTPGETFTKTWRIKNVGTCSWTPSYTVIFDHGEQMSGPSTQAMVGNVNPGQTIDISVNLKAPATDNHYVGYWKLRNASGVTFTNFYVDIKVVTSGGGGSGGATFAVTHVELAVSTFTNGAYVNCPRVKAKITTNKAGTVKYHYYWTGSTGSMESLSFPSGTTLSANAFEWYVGPLAPGPLYVGIYIDEPNHQDFGSVSVSPCTGYP